VSPQARNRMAAGFTIAAAIVIVAPAFAMRWGGLRAGVGSLDADILAASLAVAGVNTAVSWGHMRDEEHLARRRLHVSIASLDALVVLALGASLLFLVLLAWFPDEHASMADRGFPVVVLWAGSQLVAVLLAEVTARFAFWWLEPRTPRPALRPRRPQVG
jgi:hypothetical protein